MTEALKDLIYQQLRGVLDPSLNRDLVTLNAVRQVKVDGRRVTLLLAMPGVSAETRSSVEASAKQAISGLQGVDLVEVEFEGVEKPSHQQQARKDNPLPGVKHIIAVGAGKGGVGKSTVAVNLAVGLAREGHRVGLLDGDIYGPSLPTMMGLHDMPPYMDQDRNIRPFEVHGVKTITLGKLVDPDKPLIWRGPMAHGAFTQLVSQTAWGELDYFIIDLPPGTGDVPLTMAQTLPLLGAIVVCTPQRVARDDARRAAGMFRQLGIDVLGVVENMSYFVGDDGKEYDIFGRGGAREMAEEIEAEFLGGIPINMNLRRNSDSGDPSANFAADDVLRRDLEAFTAAARKRVEEHAAAAGGPTLSIS